MGGGVGGGQEESFNSLVIARIAGKRGNRETSSISECDQRAGEWKKKYTGGPLSSGSKKRKEAAKKCTSTSSLE